MIGREDILGQEERGGGVNMVIAMGVLVILAVAVRAPACSLGWPIGGVLCAHPRHLPSRPVVMVS